MKRILITGANSYIGASFEEYMKEYDGYQIETLDMKNPEWRNHDFSSYDTVFHVAGIAHQKETKENAHLYYEINRDLAVEVARKSKDSQVNQFVFMSSMSVYGLDYSHKVINIDTPLKPKTNYGKSKIEAEQEIMKLQDKDFIISIMRPPMIYGPGCKGNYQMLSKMAKRLPIFPNIRNERSMLYIGNLCSFIKECIDEQKGGIYFPQNSEYISTSRLVLEIAKANNRTIHLTKALNPIVYIASKIPGKIGGMCNKAFGNMTYEKECPISRYSMKQGIEETEVGK